MGAEQIDGYATAEEAARGDIPERYARILGVRVDGRDATVWMLTNDRPPFEEYTMVVYRDEHGRWESGSGACGLGSFNGVDAPAEILAAAARLGWGQRGAVDPEDSLTRLARSAAKGSRFRIE